MDTGPHPGYVYAFPRPCVTVDLVVLAPTYDNDYNVLVVERKFEPFQGMIALPGGFLDLEEPAYDAALRELEEETGVYLFDDEDPKFIGVFDAVDRDPRARTISIAYGLLIGDCNQYKPKPGDDAEKAYWCNADKVGQMAFDHNRILRAAISQLTPPWLNGKAPVL